MRIAGILSGDPRFCKEFDTQLESVKDTSIDWYIAIWKRDYNSNAHWRYKLVSPFWKGDYTLDSASEFIQKRLPNNHRLADLIIVDDTEFNPKTDHYRQLHIEPYPILCQWYMVKRAWELIQKSNVNYDVVFKSRMDMALTPSINFVDIYNRIKDNPGNIISERRAHNMYAFDGWAIGLYESMKKYCQAIDYIEHFNVNLNHEFDPERIVNSIWNSFGLTLVGSDIKNSIRQTGTGKNWLPEYDPNFGSWI